MRVGSPPACAPSDPRLNLPSQWPTVHGLGGTILVLDRGNMFLTA